MFEEGAYDNRILNWYSNFFLYLDYLLLFLEQSILQTTNVTLRESLGKSSDILFPDIKQLLLTCFYLPKPELYFIMIISLKSFNAILWMVQQGFATCRIHIHPTKLQAQVQRAPKATVTWGKGNKIPVLQFLPQHAPNLCWRQSRPTGLPDPVQIRTAVLQWSQDRSLKPAIFNIPTQSKNKLCDSARVALHNGWAVQHSLMSKSNKGFLCGLSILSLVCKQSAKINK